MAATIYDVQIPNVTGIPPTLDVHITVMRHDGRPLTRAELEALAAVYPPPTAEARAALDRAIEVAPSVAAEPTTPVAKPRAKARKPASKSRVPRVR